jgi:NAD+ kinase
VEDTLKDNSAFKSKCLIEKDSSYSQRLKFWDNELCRQAPQIFDIVIALGGDGTVLYASWLFQKVVPPVLSFALGSLGFLTKFDYESHRSSLTSVFTKGFNVNLRLRFEATIMRKKPCDSLKGKDIVDELIGDLADTRTHDADGCHNILNEVVLDRGPSGSKFDLFNVSSYETDSFDSHGHVGDIR